MTSMMTHRTDIEHDTVASAAKGLGVHVEIPESVRSASQVHEQCEAGDGGRELLVTLTRGNVYANIERSDFLESDGTPDTSGIEVSVFLPGGNGDFLGEQRVGFCSDDAGRMALLDDVAVITSAAARFVSAYIETSTAQIEVR